MTACKGWFTVTTIDKNIIRAFKLHLILTDTWITFFDQETWSGEKCSRNQDWIKFEKVGNQKQSKKPHDHWFVLQIKDKSDDNCLYKNFISRNDMALLPNFSLTNKTNKILQNAISNFKQCFKLLSSNFKNSWLMELNFCWSGKICDEKHLYAFIMTELVKWRLRTAVYCNSDNLMKKLIKIWWETRSK